MIGQQTEAIPESDVRRAWRKWRALRAACDVMDGCIEADEELSRVCDMVECAQQHLISLVQKEPDDWAYQFDAMPFDPRESDSLREMYRHVQRIIGETPSAVLEFNLDDEEWPERIAA